MRVLHSPVNIGNQAWNLSRAERRLGLQSDVITNYSTWFGFPSDVSMGAPGDWAPQKILRRAWHAARSPFAYDVLHCYFGRSLTCWEDLGPRTPLWYADLRMARALGRRLVMTLQGCDARQADRSEARNEVTMCRDGRCGSYATCVASLDDQRRRMIAEALPLFDRVFYLNPELGHEVPSGEFLPYANVDVDAYEPIPPRTTGPVRILHAPSDSGIKGTPDVIAAVERLQARHDIEFTLVEGVPHDEALGLYATADLVIDQVLSGWYGGLAVEVMAMGKPVACYLREEDLGFLPSGMADAIPICRVHPSRLEADLDALLARRDEWPSWSAQARAYARTWHHPDRIAAALARVYRDPAASLDLRPKAEESPCAA